MKHPKISLACLVLTALLCAPLQAQDQQKCDSLDNKSAMQLVPDWVPLETEVLPVDTGNLTAIRFPDRSRIAIAPLRTSSYSRAIQSKYQFILVSETKLMIEDQPIPSGLIGLALEPEPGTEGPACTLVARDFSGRQITRIGMKTDTGKPPAHVSLVPSGEKEFNIRFGTYVVAGRQR